MRSLYDPENIVAKSILNLYKLLEKPLFVQAIAASSLASSFLLNASYLFLLDDENYARFIKPFSIIAAFSYLAYVAVPKSKNYLDKKTTLYAFSGFALITLAAIAITLENYQYVVFILIVACLMPIEIYIYNSLMACKAFTWCYSYRVLQSFSLFLTCLTSRNPTALFAIYGLTSAIFAGTSKKVCKQHKLESSPLKFNTIAKACRYSIYSYSPQLLSAILLEGIAYKYTMAALSTGNGLYALISYRIISKYSGMGINKQNLIRRLMEVSTTMLLLMAVACILDFNPYLLFTLSLLSAFFISTYVGLGRISLIEHET